MDPEITDLGDRQHTSVTDSVDLMRPAEPIDLSVVRVHVWHQMMAFNELQQVRGIQKKEDRLKN